MLVHDFLKRPTFLKCDYKKEKEKVQRKTKKHKKSICIDIYCKHILMYIL